MSHASVIPGLGNISHRIFECACGQLLLKPEELAGAAEDI
jgi:hypothetical protein